MAAKERWAAGADEKDLTAAATYLSLLATDSSVAAIVESLRRAPVVNHRANDLLRASSLPLLPADDPEVAKDLKKVKKGVPLAVVLLVRGRAEDAIPLVIADGYHRICASYHLDEDAEIPCQMADVIPASGGRARRTASGARARRTVSGARARRTSTR